MQQIKYFHTYVTHVKQRWLDRHLIDVLVSEFRGRSKEYYLGAIDCGVVTVNDGIVSPMYYNRDLDIIRHTVHIHEPIPPTIEIIKQEDDYLVVNKPFGIPCHPTGGYFEYSVTRTLFKDRAVGCVNRLDMPVSGVLIITFNNSYAAHEMLNSAEKIYIAKVAGKFPESIFVDRPIGLVGTRIFDVSETGKPSYTSFRLLEYKNGFSLVECKPKTGRTHQIRIHLKYAGFPIVNDILYGDAANIVESNELNNNCTETVDNINDKYIIEHCKGTNNRSFEISKSYICLHAWKYTFNEITYEPSWANI